jgi:hypothetical protein
LSYGLDKLKTTTMPSVGNIVTVKNVASFMTMGASNLIMNDTVMNGLS